MLEQIKYTNHNRDSIISGTDGIYFNYNDIRDFEWSVQTRNDKISGFNKGLTTKSIPLIIVCSSESEGIEKKNALFELFEQDVLSKEYGKLIVGDYYMECFITGSTKSNYLIDKGYLELKLKVTTDRPYWIAENEIEFNMESQSTSAYLDYSFDYSFDYMSSVSSNNINNPNYMDADFKMMIFGFCENPAIYIGSHTYQVNVTVEQGDYLLIDSTNKSITLVKYTGERINCFNDRKRDSYIFKKIPTGNSVVRCNSDILNFTITLIDERGEPKWI